MSFTKNMVDIDDLNKRVAELEKITSGEFGVHLWRKIIKGSEIGEADNDNYYIAVEKIYIEKGYLDLQEAYKVVFKLAKYECPSFSEPSNPFQECKLRYGMDFVEKGKPATKRDYEELFPEYKK